MRRQTTRHQKRGNTALMDVLKWVAQAKIYDLEQPRFHGMPVFHELKAPFAYYLYRQHQNQYRPEQHGPRTSATGLIMDNDHSGTHIDALCHQAGDLKLYGGVPVDEKTQTPWGFTKLGAETIPPLVCRGVLLDIPAVKGEDPLPEKYEVTREDLTSCVKAERISIKNGDVALVRVGVGRFWSDSEQYYKCAGVSAQASLWLAQKRVQAVGIDNLSWDIPEVYDPLSGSYHAGHYHMIFGNGVYMIENMYLEELAGDRCYTFLFVGLPPKIKGATGSPIRPIAIGSTG